MAGSHRYGVPQRYISHVGSEGWGGALLGFAPAFIQLTQSSAMAQNGSLGRVAFMTGHDDDVVLDPRVASELGRASASRTSKWKGMQSDLAIVEVVRTSYPQLQVETVQTVEQLLATKAEVVVIISYKTQMSFAWYSAFFAALRALEMRGTTVYPSADFKETISSKAQYTKLLQAAGLPLCPTAFLERSECVGADGSTLMPSRVDACLTTALTSIGLLPPLRASERDDATATEEAPRHAAASHSPFHLVTKPSNADGGFGVAFWEAAARRTFVATSGAQAASTRAGREGSTPAGGEVGGEAENADLQRAPPTAATTATASAAATGACTHSSSAAVRASPGNAQCGAQPATAQKAKTLVGSLQLRAMLTAGNDIPGIAAAASSCNDKGEKEKESEEKEEKEEEEGEGSAFCDYLRAVGFVGNRPHVLLQPLVPSLAQHFEIKIYFLMRQPFYAALVYGKEKLMAKVARPSTDPALFAYLEPLLHESIRALEELPPDGPHDPKILMRVDWGTGEPLLPPTSEAAEAAGATEAADGAEASSTTADEASSKESGFLKRALVKRAGSLAAPQKKLKRSMDVHRTAPLTGSQRHFINEVEIHPGYYVDWDATPDATLEPLGKAYGDYIVRLLTERRTRG